MQIFKKKTNIVISYIVITFGLALFTFAWSTFMLPAKIISGGVTGMSSIIHFLTPGNVSIGLLSLLINSVLLLLGFTVMGSKFGANTIYGIVVSSLFFILWQDMLHIEQYINGPELMGGNDFLCAIVGGMLCGIGMGVCFSMGGNTGGTDIIALIASKYYNISPGKVIMLIDLVIIGCTFFVSHSFDKVIYGYIVMAAATYVLDLVIDGNKQSYQIMVFSSHNDEIGETVTKEVGRGATMLNAEGLYSHREQKVLLMMVHRTDKPHVMRIIHRIDQDAFISVSKAQGVYGKNFEKLKL